MDSCNRPARAGIKAMAASAANSAALREIPVCVCGAAPARNRRRAASARAASASSASSRPSARSRSISAIWASKKAISATLSSCCSRRMASGASTAITAAPVMRAKTIQIIGIDLSCRRLQGKSQSRPATEPARASADPYKNRPAADAGRLGASDFRERLTARHDIRCVGSGSGPPACRCWRRAACCRSPSPVPSCA